MTVRIVAEGLLLGALLAAFCAIGIRNGAVNMVFLYHADVQERCIRNGLITREAIRQKAAAFKGLGIAVYLIFLLVSVYAVNGARGFWIGFWQMFAILFLYPLYLLLFIYWAISAHCAGITGFWTLFWTGYAEMTIVSISDFLILDCWLPPKAKPYIKGAEHCEAWAVREWLLKLAIPEHALVWTFLVCPLAGFAVAGLGTLLG